MLLVSPAKAGVKKLDSLVEEQLGVNKLAFLPVNLYGNGGKVVCKSGLPGQKKKFVLADFFFFYVSTAQMCHSSPEYVLHRYPVRPPEKTH